MTFIKEGLASLTKDNQFPTDEHPVEGEEKSLEEVDATQEEAEDHPNLVEVEDRLNLMEGEEQHLAEGEEKSLEKEDATQEEVEDHPNLEEVEDCLEEEEHHPNLEEVGDSLEEVGVWQEEVEHRLEEEAGSAALEGQFPDKAVVRNLYSMEEVEHCLAEVEDRPNLVEVEDSLVEVDATQEEEEDRHLQEKNVVPEGQFPDKAVVQNLYSMEEVEHCLVEVDATQEEVEDQPNLAEVEHCLEEEEYQPSLEEVGDSLEEEGVWQEEVGDSLEEEAEHQLNLEEVEEHYPAWVALVDLSVASPLSLAGTAEAA